MNTPEQTKCEFLHGFALGADIDRSLARAMWSMLSSSIPDGDRARDEAQGWDRGFELGGLCHRKNNKRS